MTNDVGAFRRWTTRAGWVLAVAVPLWMAGSRFLTGSAGDLTPVYALTLCPVLLLLSVVALGVSRRRPGRYPSARSLGLMLIAWACGLGLGWTLPDTGEGASSVLGALVGPQAEGAAAAFSNPLGIIMLFMSITGCVLAVRDSSRPGGARRSPDDEDDYQGTGYYPVLDV
jgi:hypothetical protein